MSIRNILSSLAIVVVLTPNGFEPSKISVPVGTTVTFETTRGRYFWPASNDHPTHTQYPEFDSKRPIGTSETWSFQLDSSGTWGFHDHISPNFTGVIEVTESAQPLNAAEKKSVYTYLKTFITQYFPFIHYSRCRNDSLDRSERIGCWEKIVIGIVQKKGLGAALNFVDREKNRNTAFAADCHVYVHRIGEEYYWMFFNDKKVEVSDKFDLCDHGFFHGFMQEFTSHGQSIREAKRYCDSLIALIKDEDDSDMLMLQCHHGIGHGLTLMYAPYYWGDNEEIMRRAVTDCRTLFPDAPRFCISGVYGGMAAMYWGLHGFTLTMDRADPFALCKNQKMPDLADCYDQLVPVLFGELGLEQSGRIIEGIQDEEVAGFLMEHLGSMPSYTIVPKTDDYSPVVVSCRTFSSRLALHCLRGFGLSLKRMGSVAEGYARFTKFCSSDMLTQEEKHICEGT